MQSLRGPLRAADAARKGRDRAWLERSPIHAGQVSGGVSGESNARENLRTKKVAIQNSKPPRMRTVRRHDWGNLKGAKLVYNMSTGILAS